MRAHGKGQGEQGAAGDHKGPPFPTLPPSPQRTEDDASNKPSCVSPGGEAPHIFLSIFPGTGPVTLSITAPS